LLPGGTGGKVQVIATDGFHTVQALSSGTFTVPHHAPIVTINSPADGQKFSPEEWIKLTGSASDATGDVSNDFTYIWSINGLPIEVGPEVDILAGEGVHTITLTVYDDLGNFSEDSVTINVRRLLYSASIPLIQK
jgi:hypothetical protein